MTPEQSSHTRKLSGANPVAAALSWFKDSSGQSRLQTQRRKPGHRGKPSHWPRTTRTQTQEPAVLTDSRVLSAPCPQKKAVLATGAALHGAGNGVSLAPCPCERPAPLPSRELRTAAAGTAHGPLRAAEAPGGCEEPGRACNDRSGAGRAPWSRTERSSLPARLCCSARGTRERAQQVVNLAVSNSSSPHTHIYFPVKGLTKRLLKLSGRRNKN